MRLSLIDETLDINRTKEYDISIQASLDGFSFSIMDNVHHKIVCLYHQDTHSHHTGVYMKRLNSIYDQAELLAQPYNNTRIFYSAPDKTSIVPEVFFKPELAADFFNIASYPSHGGEIIYSHVHALSSYAVFEIPTAIRAFMNEKHPSAKIENDLAIYAKIQESNDKVVNVTIRKKHVTITIPGEQLNFYNSFYYETDNDLLYFILGTVNNLKLEPDEVILNGLVSRQSEIYHRMKQYFKKVGIAAWNKDLHCAAPIAKLSDARFVSLLNSHRPASAT